MSRQDRIETLHDVLAEIERLRAWNDCRVVPSAEYADALDDLQDFCKEILGKDYLSA